MRKILTLASLAVLAAVLFAGGWLVGRTGIGSVVDPRSLTEAERRFADSMKNVILVGTFTVDGRENPTPSPDRYEISSVEKVGDDLWRFDARMDCCGLGGAAAIPIVVPMRWVGDTPVILMTDTTLPGLGTFTVRVFFHGDRYAGTWQHGRVGGYMSGRIDRQDRANP